jgi:hypothetical protein
MRTPLLFGISIQSSLVSSLIALELQALLGPGVHVYGVAVFGAQRVLLPYLDRLVSLAGYQAT